MKYLAETGLRAALKAILKHCNEVCIDLNFVLKHLLVYNYNCKSSTLSCRWQKLTQSTAFAACNVLKDTCDSSTLELEMRQTGTASIKIGDEVRIQGLRAYQHLNGTTGIAIEWKNERWVVLAGNSVFNFV